MSQQDSRPLVSVIVPTYGRPEKLIRCLDSVFRSDYHELEVIVVDDLSPTSVEGRVMARFPQVKVLRNERRLLLAASRNRGMLSSHGELMLFVDDDNVLDRKAIGELVGAAQGSVAGVVSPIIFYLEHPTILWYAGSWMSPLSGVAVFPYRGGSKPPQSEPYPTGLFHDVFMVRKNVFDVVGPFDVRNFPIYLSEADLSERMKMKGFSTLVVPAAIVWHDVPLLGGFRTLLRHMHITEPARAYYVARNRIIFVKRYRTLWQRLVFTLFFVPVIATIHLVSILASTHANRIYLVRNYLGGVIAGLSATGK